MHPWLLIVVLGGIVAAFFWANNPVKEHWSLLSTSQSKRETSPPPQDETKQAIAVLLSHEQAQRKILLEQLGALAARIDSLVTALDNLKTSNGEIAGPPNNVGPKERRARRGRRRWTSGDPDHLNVFANADAAEARFAENDPEGVAFKYEILVRQVRGSFLALVGSEGGRACLIDTPGRPAGPSEERIEAVRRKFRDFKTDPASHWISEVIWFPNAQIIQHRQHVQGAKA
jgi:hypothetical protein